jgi:hypothetical protein
MGRGPFRVKTPLFHGLGHCSRRVLTGSSPAGAGPGGNRPRTGPPKVRLPEPNGSVRPLSETDETCYIRIMKEIALAQLALQASFALNDQLLNDCCYAGYEGDKESFDRLYDEVYVICRDELPDDADVDQVVEMFHDYQLEIMDGLREVDWYL